MPGTKFADLIWYICSAFGQRLWYILATEKRAHFARTTRYPGTWAPWYADTQLVSRTLARVFQHVGGVLGGACFPTWCVGAVKIEGEWQIFNVFQHVGGMFGGARFPTQNAGNQPCPDTPGTPG